MTNHEFSKPSSAQERLDAAKAAFRDSILENDTFFSVLQARLQETDSTNVSLPDFDLEPTIRRNEDNTSTIGLRIVRIDRSATALGGAVSAPVSVYDYLSLGQMDRTTGEAKITPELEAALTAVGKEKSDALGMLQAWQASVGEMSAQFYEPLMLNPLTDTFELKAETMVPNYEIERGQ